MAKTAKPSRLAGISIITLGSDDLEKASRFYETMGFIDSAMSNENVKFLQGNNVVLGLYGRQALAEDAEVERLTTGASAVTIAVNLEDEAAVDTLFDEAIAAGATATKKPKKTFWGGYSGYFKDPDGHLWEIAHNPFAKRDASGKLDLAG